MKAREYVDMTQYVPRGYRNGISRDSLRELTGFRDREMRKCIEWTNQHIETVYSYNGRYFLYGGREDDYYCKHYYNTERNRAITQNQKVRRMRGMWGEKKQDQTPGQLSLDLG